ncbi:protein CROWDED NUCLEI 3 [Drosophila rhopaloa]|uniref:Uncharacterized protein n=1 Tax=Drosophila rhopaloa TaxID=1041015 RepID=A0ABM5I691_DRORH|nr:protein CROWDED NUCLEI 3 [Drosophila rhopaloa]
MEVDEVKSLEGMPDCAKVRLNQMDTITRTLRCVKSDLEIFDVDEEVSFSNAEEEEQMELYEISEDVTDDAEKAVKVVHDIDCLIRQIELMQITIKSRQFKESSEKVSEKSEEHPIETLTKAQIKCKEQENEENERDSETQVKSSIKQPKFIPLEGQELLEARSLRQAHHCIQLEIDKVICRYQNFREIIHKMREQFRCMELQLEDLISKSREQLAWTHEVAKEMKVCKERHTYLLDVKMSKHEVLKTAKVHAARFAKKNSAYLNKSRLRREIFEFSEEVNDLVLFMGELHQELHRNMALLEKPRMNKQENPTEFIMSIAESTSLSHKFAESRIKLEVNEMTQN